MATVFITGATGFMGKRLAVELLRRGHQVRALVRKGSEAKAVPGTEVVMGDPLRSDSYRDRVAGADTFVHLVGVAHPNPSKADEFRDVDLASAKASIDAASGAAVKHFVFVSVAHPAPVMKEYIAARVQAESAVGAAGLNATILRPWYVLGPGRRWPLILLPLYWVMEALPRTRQGARRLGLVTIDQMVRTMVDAIEHPPSGIRVVEPPQIRVSRV
jgi:uncharacterized protein YbjT (DUF2867 family)